MNTMKTTLLLGAMTLLFVYAGAALGGKTGMIIAFGIAVVMNFTSYFYSDKMVLKMYKAREIKESESPWLYQTVQQLTQRAQIPMPKLYMIPSDQPNAFATGRNPEHAAVAVTQGISRILERDELAGVLAHELAHVKNRDILIGTIAATIAGALGMMSKFAMFTGGARGGEGRGNPLIGIAILILAPVAAMIVQMAISRTREYKADKTGAELLGASEPLAQALAKLHNASRTIPMNTAEPATAHMFIVSPLFGKGFSSLFSTHPPMEKRIEALRSMQL